MKRRVAPWDVSEISGARLGINPETGRVVVADGESGVLILGPPRSGKTSGVIIPTINRWDGPVVSTSVRNVILLATYKRRQEEVVDLRDSESNTSQALAWVPLPDQREIRDSVSWLSL